jgi:hypothetical protein
MDLLLWIYAFMIPRSAFSDTGWHNRVLLSEGPSSHLHGTMLISYLASQTTLRIGMETECGLGRLCRHSGKPESSSKDMTSLSLRGDTRRGPTRRPSTTQKMTSSLSSSPSMSLLSAASCLASLSSSSSSSFFFFAATLAASSSAASFCFLLDTFFRR